MYWSNVGFPPAKQNFRKDLYDISKYLKAWEPTSDVVDPKCEIANVLLRLALIF
jgi:hypothetical protein